jgi:hypothetical protein
LNSRGWQPYCGVVLIQEERRIDESSSVVVVVVAWSGCLLSQSKKVDRENDVGCRLSERTRGVESKICEQADGDRSEGRDPRLVARVARDAVYVL